MSMTSAAAAANTTIPPCGNEQASSSSSSESQQAVYVLVFAHPDDESMFFVPTVRWLVQAGKPVWFLCLTTGNYDGLGSLRETELEKAGQKLGAAKVIVRNDSDCGDGNSNCSEAILDHPTRRYDPKLVARAIRESLCKHHNPNRPLVLITFDAKGVSGHVNHTDVYRGVAQLLKEQEEQRQQQSQHNNSHSETTISSSTQDESSLRIMEAWYLESEANLLVKYLPALSWILLLVSFFASSFGLTSHCIPSEHKRSRRIVRMHDPRRNWAAMATHRSQFVWYRRLFVVFSCYTYCNTFVCLHASDGNKDQSPTTKKTI